MAPLDKVGQGGGQDVEDKALAQVLGCDRLNRFVFADLEPTIIGRQRHAGTQGERKALVDLRRRKGVDGRNHPIVTDGAPQVFGLDRRHKPADDRRGNFGLDIGIDPPGAPGGLVQGRFQLLRLRPQGILDAGGADVLVGEEVIVMIDHARFRDGVVDERLNIRFKAHPVAGHQTATRVGQTHGEIFNGGDRRLAGCVDHHATRIEPIGNELGNGFGYANVTSFFRPGFAGDERKEVKNGKDGDDNRADDREGDKRHQHDDQGRGDGACQQGVEGDAIGR